MSNNPLIFGFLLSTMPSRRNIHNQANCKHNEIRLSKKSSCIELRVRIKYYVWLHKKTQFNFNGYIIIHVLHVILTNQLLVAF